jgi:hypothetical protein
MKIRLATLGQVIAGCWEAAEKATAEAIAEKYPDPVEENITFLFGGELRASVTQASKKNHFAEAFLADLQGAFPELGIDTSLQAAGLVARVNLHGRRHEGYRSGSDLGVIITQPSVLRHPILPQLNIVRDSSRVLMAQAKLNKRQGRRDGRKRWQVLTRPQKKLLPLHQECSAILLYRLDGVTRSNLAPFGWQLCRGHSIDEIGTWLRLGTFPKEITSAEVILGLSVGDLGIETTPEIQNLADPPVTWPNAIEIQVFWPDGAGPPGFLSLYHRSKQEAQQHVVQFMI